MGKEEEEFIKMLMSGNPTDFIKMMMKDKREKRTKKEKIFVRKMTEDEISTWKDMEKRRSIIQDKVHDLAQQMEIIDAEANLYKHRMLSGLGRKDRGFMYMIDTETKSIYREEEVDAGIRKEHND
jgi:hypothetical protein